MKKRYTIIGALLVAFSQVAFLLLTPANQLFQTKDVLPAASQNVPSVLTSIKDQLALREYNITYDSSLHALQSPNRLHNLRTYYRPGNISVRARIDTIGRNFQLDLVNKGIYADGGLLFKTSPDAIIRNQGDTLRFHHKHFTEELPTTKTVSDKTLSWLMRLRTQKRYL